MKNKINPLIYEKIRPFKCGLACVKKGGKYGFINKKGEIVIPLIYEWATSFSGGIAVVRKGGKNFHINLKGEISEPPNYAT